MASYSKSDILNMTVAEFVAKTNFKVKLGAKDGSAFVFCGSIADMDIEQLDTAIVKGYKGSLRSAQYRIRHLEEQDTSYKTFKAIHEEQCSATGIYTDPQIAYATMLRDRKHQLKVSRKTKQKIELKLRDYTSIGNRKIVDMRSSVVEDDAYIVLFEGRENGSWWTVAEFESGVRHYGKEHMDSVCEDTTE